MSNIFALQVQVQEETDLNAKRKLAFRGINTVRREIDDIRENRNPQYFGAAVNNRLVYLDDKASWFSNAIRECNIRIAASK